MKHLLACLLGCAMTGCALLFTPADAPATISRGAGGRQVMFTFDARDSDAYAAQVLDMLHRYRVPAVFFVTGQFVEQHPELTRRIAAEGHEIYNHSYSNPLLWHAPAAKIIEQLRRADAAIVHATGRSSKPFFRPAFGESDENLRRVAFAEGYRVVRWSIESDDWKEDLIAPVASTTTVAQATSSAYSLSGSSSGSGTSLSWTDKQKEERAVQNLLDKNYKPPDPVLLYATNVVERYQSGSIVLFHIGYSNTVQILEPLIKVTRGKDYTIVPLRDGVRK